MKCTQCGTDYNGNICPKCGSTVKKQGKPQQSPDVQQQKKQSTNVQQIPTYQTPPSYYQAPVSTQQPQKQKTEWWKIAIGALIFLFLVGACFGDDSEANNSYSDNQKSSNQITEKTNEHNGNEEEEEEYDEYEEDIQEEIQEDESLDGCTIEVHSAEKWYSTGFTVIVTYEFINNSNRAKSFSGTIYTEADQNGVSLEKDYVNYKNTDKKVKPGSSVLVSESYLLNDTKTPVEIELRERWSLSDKVVTKTILLE